MADSRAVAEMAKVQSLFGQAFTAWRAAFDSPVSADAESLGKLEGECARLRTQLAEREREIEVLREIASRRF